MLIIVTLLVRKALRRWVHIADPVARAAVGRFGRPGGGMTTCVAEDVFGRSQRDRRIESSLEAPSRHRD